MQYYNYTVINFDELIESTNLGIINYYSDNNIPLKKITTDFKKIFVHFFIKQLFSSCLSNNKLFDRILFCNPYFVSENLEIFEYIKYDDYVSFVKRILNEIEDIIPVAVYYSSELLYNEISSKTLNDLKFSFDFISSKKNNKSIHKLSQYAQTLELNFLYKDYLKRLDFRKIFI